MFEDYMMRNYPNMTPDDMTRAKDKEFAMWCKNYVSDKIKYMLYACFISAIKLKIYAD